MPIAALILLTAVATTSTNASDTTSPAANPGDAALPTTLRICGDEDEWPPFTFFQRVNGQKSQTVVGYNIDFLHAMLKDSGLQFSVDMLPWRRCLADAKQGRYDLVLDGSDAPIREQEFLLPPSHYLLTPVYLHRKETPASVFKQPETLKKLVICGQAGYAYNLRNTPLQHMHINKEANSLDAGIKMVESGRCDALLFEREKLVGYQLLGRHDLLASGQLTYTESGFAFGNAKFYIMVSPATPYHQNLLQLLTTRIEHMHRSGQSERLLKHYFPTPNR